jgi:hypothetical protein
MQVTIERTTLVAMLGHASSAARIVGHLDDARAAGPLADHVDALVHELSELLGAPCAREDDEDDEVTEFSLRAPGAEGVAR